MTAKKKIKYNIVVWAYDFSLELNLTRDEPVDFSNNFFKVTRKEYKKCKDEQIKNDNLKKYSAGNGDLYIPITWINSINQEQVKV